MKKCKGCGAILQNDNESLIGYVKKIEQDYCMRCFRLTHYGDLTIDLKKEIERKDVFELIKDYDLPVLFVIDIFSLEASLTEDIINYLKGKNVIIVLTKIDLLPYNTNTSKLESYIVETIKEKLVNSKVLEVLLTFKNDEEVLNYLFEDLNKLNYKKVLVIGNSNAGKSTLLNKLANSNDLTVSRYLSTTISTNEIEINGITFIDTPGLVDFGNILMSIDQGLVKDLTIKNEIRPTVFQMYENQGYSMDGLFHFVTNNGKKASVVFYIDNMFNIHRGKAETLNDFVDKHHLEFKYQVKTPKKPITIDLNYEYMDLVIDGFGFISFKNVKSIDLYINENIKYNLRKGIM